jgi:predicted O-methyltransferase YrrM
MNEDLIQQRGWVPVEVYKHAMDSRVRAALWAIEHDPQSPGGSDIGTLNLLYAWILSIRPHRVLELGTHLGYSAIVMAHALRLNGFGRLITVEPDALKVEKTSDRIEQARLSEHVELLCGFSTDDHIIEKAAAEAPFQLLYIDSLHNYRSCLQDIWTYVDLLQPGGMIFWHDASIYSRDFDAEGLGGVRRAIEEYAFSTGTQVLVFEPPVWLNPVGCAIAIKPTTAPPPTK